MPPEIPTSIPNNTEIEEALKKFQIDQASGIVGNPVSIPTAQQNPETSKMVSLVMKLSGGTITEERQAEYVLLGIVVLVIVISIFLFSSSAGTTSKVKVTPEMVQQMKQSAQSNYSN